MPGSQHQRHPHRVAGTMSGADAHLQGDKVGRGLQLGTLLKGASNQNESQQHGGLLEKGAPAQRGQPCRHAAHPECSTRTQGHQGVHIWRPPPNRPEAVCQNLPARPCRTVHCGFGMLLGPYMERGSGLLHAGAGSQDPASIMCCEMIPWPCFPQPCL